MSTCYYPDGAISEACTQYCNDSNEGTSFDDCISSINVPNVVMPRAAQLSATASSSSSATAGAQNDSSPGGLCGPGDGYTGAQMAGLGVGVGVPFALAFFVTLILLARERKRNKALIAGGASPAAYDPLKGQEGDATQLYVQQ
ncbi:hypothetical protein GTA08_BOTSDO10832 [Botryosphaeria dothidea]|uniref:Uncharacterized protein n=1 Tax=Botryosphaeria dothidea TaxID=55169 RepID=A0A8H4IH78_9PEZI|nr:hypothetical protein GTA08_BOTSDO10832 [Botryosphaeria dothidea]